MSISGEVRASQFRPFPASKGINDAAVHHTRREGALKMFSDSGRPRPPCREGSISRRG